MNKKQLVEKLKILHVPDAEGWAESQIEEGINQYSRAKALRMMWNGVLPEDDQIVIGFASKELPEPDRPFGVYGYIMGKMLRSGISEEEIRYFIRCVQVEFISHMASCSDGVFGDEDPTYGIRICDVDENSDSVEFPDGLHESVLGFDSNEMRPNDRLVGILKTDPEYNRQIERIKKLS